MNSEVIISSDNVEMEDILGGEVAHAPSDRSMEIAALRAEVNEVIQKAFSCSNSADSGIHVHHEKLGKMLKAQEKVKSINDAHQEEGKGIPDNGKYPVLGPCIVGEAKSAVNNLQDL